MKTQIQQSLPSDLDLNEVVKQARQVSAALDYLGIVKATAENGDTYMRDAATDTKSVAMRGVAVEFGKSTLAITVQLPEASIDGTLAETTHLTQTMQGSLIGKSQSTVSRRRKKS